MPARHCFRQVDGVRLHWAEHGRSDRRTPLVLLHGLSDCYRTWMHLAPRLAQDRRVLALDLPGHGLSERPDATYELDWHARIVSRWLAELGLEGFDLVGHSFGGGVAQMILLRCANRVRRLVLVSSGGLGREVALALRLAALPRVLERFGQAFMGAGTRLTLRARGHQTSEGELARLVAMSGRPGSARALGRTVTDVIDWHGQRRSLFERAHELPTLPVMAVFWGVHDNVIPISHARGLSRRIEGVVLEEFEKSGHYPHYDETDRFEQALRTFLDTPHVPAARWVTSAESVTWEPMRSSA
jgi:pimeloyl-ACP methyl ester carboxylesterase